MLPRTLDMAKNLIELEKPTLRDFVTQLTHRLAKCARDPEGKTDRLFISTKEIAEQIHLWMVGDLPYSVRRLVEINLSEIAKAITCDGSGCIVAEVESYFWRTMINKAHKKHCA